MVEKKTITRGGSTYEVRVNPPRDASGKALPTGKQVKARETQSKRMKQAWKVIRRRYPDEVPKVGSKKLSKELKELLSFDTNADGKRHSHLKQSRAKECRKDGKIAVCNL